MTVVNPDGSQVKIEAVYWRHMCVYAAECDSIEEAVGFLDWGEEEGTLSSVGVFVDGEPRRVESEWIDEPNEQTLKDYAKAMRPDA